MALQAMAFPLGYPALRAFYQLRRLPFGLRLGRYWHTPRLCQIVIHTRFLQESLYVFGWVEDLATNLDELRSLAENSPFFQGENALTYPFAKVFRCVPLFKEKRIAFGPSPLRCSG